MNIFSIKKFQLRRNRSKDFKLFLFSYIIVFLIPLVTTSFGYWYCYRTIQQNAYLYHSILLHQGKNVYDEIFKQISSDVKLISSTSLTSSLGKKNSWGPEDLFQVVKLRNELATIKRNNNYLDHVGVYFHKNKSFITNEKRYTEAVSSLHLEKLHISLDDFLDQCNQLEGYFIIEHKNGARILYYRNAYGYNHKDKIATAYVIISCDNIAQQFKSFEPQENSGFFMRNYEDQVLWNSNHEVPIDMINNNFLSSINEMKHIYINQTEYIVGTIASDILDGRYVIYTPKQILFQKISYLKYIIIVQTILSISLGIFLAYYFTRKNYGPIEKLLNLIISQKDSNTDIDISRSYLHLERALRELLQDNRTLKEKLRNSIARDMEWLLTCFMKGFYTHEDKALDFLNREPRTSNITQYRIILFSFKNLENNSFFNKDAIDKDDKISDTYDLLIFSIRNVVNELLLSGPYKGLDLEIDDMIACIIPVRDRQDLSFEQNVHKCIYFLKDAFGLESYVSISDVHSQWSELPIAYEEAFMAKIHKTFWGNEIDNIVYYIDESTCDVKHHHNYVFLKEMKKLSNCIITKKYKEAFEILNNTLENCFSKDIRYIRYNQCLASSIIGIIMDIIMDNVDTLEGDETNKIYSIDTQLAYFERLLTTKSLPSLKNEIYKIFNEIIEIQQKKQANEPGWLEKVKEYIINNYKNPDINISHIADKFSMSVSYLGGTFKKFEGMSILDYIHLLRINECKKLLLQGMTLKNCAEAVGYTDAKTLIRAFKRYEGITPGQYRTNAKIIATTSDGK